MDIFNVFMGLRELPHKMNDFNNIRYRITLDSSVPAFCLTDTFRRAILPQHLPSPISATMRMYELQPKLYCQSDAANCVRDR